MTDTALMRFRRIDEHALGRDMTDHFAQRAACRARTCSRVPAAVSTSTSESRPRYSTLSTSPTIVLLAAGTLAQRDLLGPDGDRRRAARQRLLAHAGQPDAGPAT